jgi:uncharacterized membrane protein
MASADEELSIGRLEAFSDGVFAIAITLIVLDLGISSTAHAHLLSSLLHHWPAYLAYITSFLTIGVIWLQHSEVTGTLRAADQTLYRMNLLVLGLTSFLPFPTKLLTEFFAQGGPERVAAVFYGVTMLALTLALTWFGRYATQHHELVKDQVEADRLENIMEHSPSFVLYVIGIGISLVLPSAAITLYLVSAVVRGLSTRKSGGMFARRGLPTLGRRRRGDTEHS